MADTIDKRLVDVEIILAHLPEDLDARFAGVDVKLAAIRETLALHTTRFSKLEALVSERFASIDRRLDSVNERFTSIDRRLDRMDEHFTSIDRRLDSLAEGMAQLLDRLPPKA